MVSTIVIIVLFGAFALVIFFIWMFQLIFPSTKLERVEWNYGTIKALGGILIAIGIITFLERLFSTVNTEEIFFLTLLGYGDNIILGVIGLLIGVILLFFSTYILKTKIFQPIKELVLTSSLRGKKTDYIETPQSNTQEINQFISQFNESSLNYANQLNFLKINLEELQQPIGNLISFFDRLKPMGTIYNNELKQLQAFLRNSNESYSLSFSFSKEVQQDIQSFLTTFTSLRLLLKETIEFLNVLSINIGIESIRSKNIAFEAISKKTTEYFTEFEGRSMSYVNELNRVILNLGEKFTNFEESINLDSIKTSELKERLIIANQALKRTDKIHEQVLDLKQEISSHIDSILKNKPISY